MSEEKEEPKRRFYEKTRFIVCYMITKNNLLPYFTVSEVTQLFKPYQDKWRYGVHHLKQAGVIAYIEGTHIFEIVHKKKFEAMSLIGERLVEAKPEELID